ncbi:MAG: MFS transporter [Proteobacteria bacterium]|nr:MFS transporter [Pseudomonadota bacterium]
MTAPAPPLARRALPLAAYWALSMAPFGLSLPYLALYLRENAQLTGAQIGAVFAVMPAVGILGQPIWGVLADRSGLRARSLVMISLGTAVGFLAIGRAQGFASILAATALFALFARAVIPMLLSVCLSALEDHPHAFGWVRAFGTVGFAASMFVFPAALDAYQSSHGLSATPGGATEPALGLLFPTAAALSAIAAAAALAIPNRGAVALRAERGEWKALLRNRRFLRLLSICTLAFLFVNGPMELFPILVRARGGDLQVVRDMWLFMLIPEILLITVLGTLVRRLGARALLAIGLFAGGLRWLLCGTIESLPLLYPVQMLHAIVVLGLNLGAPLYLDAVVPPQLRSTAQSMLGTVAVGIGGMASSLLAGYLLEHGGSAAPYLAGGTGALLLLVLFPRWLPPLDSVTASAGVPNGEG